MNLYNLIKQYGETYSQIVINFGSMEDLDKATNILGSYLRLKKLAKKYRYTMFNNDQEYFAAHRMLNHWETAYYSCFTNASSMVRID